MMNADMLAEEMLAAIGGKITPQRHKAFKRLATAIINHIIANIEIESTDTGHTVVVKNFLVR